MHAPADARRSRGFSLVELLVALAVFSLAVIALLNLSGHSARSAWQIEEQVLAEIVAANVAAEAMLADAGSLAAPGHGSETLGDRSWRWTREASVQGETGLLRVEVRVAAEGEDRIAAQTQLFRGAE